MMQRFFPKDTVEAAVWCGICNQETPWRIAGGRPLFCIPCYERRKAAREAAAPARPPDAQMDLFKPR
jgi:hypothetical protein